MASFDHVIVGAGINGLVCAALLAKAGHGVCLVEANDRPGGTIRTEEATLPGHRHDLMACWYPLFVTSPAYAELKDDLGRLGVMFTGNDTPTATLLPDGRHIILSTDRSRNAEAFDQAHLGDGTRYLRDMAALEADLPLTFALLGGALWSRGTLGTLGKAAWRMGTTGLACFSGDLLRPARHWLSSTFEGDLPPALLAPWVLHAGLGPNDPLSSHIARLIAYTLEAVGVPVVRGGGGKLVDAFVALLAENGATLRVGTRVSSIAVERGRAVGVVTADGERIVARRSVIAGVPPDKLYGEMLAADVLPSGLVRRAEQYRYGRAGMQIHLALDRPARWIEESLATVGMVHLTGGLGSVGRAVAEADAGFLPSDPTIVVGQPASQDPTRVPPGKGMLWIQLQELPRIVRGDAQGQIKPPPGGRWSTALAERYADRILARIARDIPGLEASIKGRLVLGPHDLERLNSNLVGGDPYCGDCGIDQFALWRPVAGVKGPKTPVPGLFHIGASAHPGPGLGGGSGYLVASMLR